MIAGWVAVSVAVAQPTIPTLSGRVVDEAGVLSASAEREITTLLREQEIETGNQLAVLTIRSLGAMAVEEYALEVARTWQLGTEQNDNGVLFLLAIDDREMRIEVGYGLEGVLPDVTASRIL
ncbi:MAG: TPM domain-containing protein, partial [Rhodothermales bacterium]|nr:TPM domain-containing protein [Rhodothermales bacterium]